MSASTSSVNHFSYGDVYRAAENGENLSILLKFYTERQQTSPINSRGDTVLHTLILNHHIKAANELLNLQVFHGLTAKNCKGNTVLHEAAKVGALEIAMLLIQKEESLICEPNLMGETPLYLAAANGHTNMFWYLARNNSQGHTGLKRNDGCTVLHAAVMGEFYGLALQIIYCYSDLALACNNKRITTLLLLCESSSSFKSQTFYSQNNIIKAPFIPLAFLALVIYFCIPSDAAVDPPEIENGETSLLRNRIQGMIRQLVNKFRWFPYLREIDDVKQKHKLALDLAKLLIRKEVEYMEQNSPTRNIINDTLMLAARSGIVEVIDVILNECPKSIDFLDENGKNIFHLAAEYRQVGVLKLLKSRGFLTIKMVADVDNMKNTALHLAAEYADHHQEKNIEPSSQKMWREMFWFKQIKDVSLVHLLHLQNSNGKTADELFNDTHKSLLETSVQNVKEDSENSIFISTLIATINFTASFAVPGGYDQDSGLPIFSKTTTYFFSFYIYASVALFFSLLSITACLSAYLSRFHRNDFYLILPLKYLVVGNSVLFAVNYTVLAFVYALISVTNAEFRVIELAFGILAVIVVMAAVILIYVDIMFPSFCYIVDVLLHSISYHYKHKLM
ncbi:protein ACCELERATED CELL DEATH 6-like isoform X1 [Macadamia integrifolia]|uniref:protein ACCELERATED CELL DEATH 6-like isoform X1 n=1 Tax=Macadamia integrifolia TaxID=60698 RepID=UPI001C4E87DE|nr:protein ACCELERATED CELL DEATH 6-like isoform X1 [Macadamia integrifolia]